MSDSLTQPPHPNAVDPSFKQRLVLPADQISYLPLAERSPLFVAGLFLNPDLDMISSERTLRLAERDGSEKADDTLDKITSRLCEPIDFFLHRIKPEETAHGINLCAYPNPTTEEKVYDLQRSIAARLGLKQGKPRGKLAIGRFVDMPAAEEARRKILQFYETKREPNKLPFITFGPMQRR